MTPAPLHVVRAAFVRAVVGPTFALPPLGSVTLHAGQTETVRRGREAIARFGGVLIANDVGSGKTYAALAIAREYARPLVLAPASLRSMWAKAMARAGSSSAFASIESLGRGRPPPPSHDLVVVDEAHHLRNPATPRYRAALEVVCGAHVVLLSATPVHNRSADLDALLALFLGADARDLDDETRARVIVRAGSAPECPRVVRHAAVALRDDALVLRSIAGLAPPLAVRDGRVAATLLHIALLRAWCSSVGALDAMLRRAWLRAAALDGALRAGRHPSRTELGAWTASDDGQLALAELIVPPAHAAAPDPAPLEQHMASIAALRARFTQFPVLDVLDDERAQHLCAIMARHAGVPVLACTQYASTVEALWTRLRGTPRVAALTARGARIASGPISREAALERFAPMAQGVRAVHDRERIDLLIATDLVSEGVNLQDAGVVVHLDLPWTAARLAQRVGRIARPGSPHAEVHAYEFAPPRAAAAVLALAARLRAKRRLAARYVGGAAKLAELIGDDGPVTPGPAEHRTRIKELLAPFADWADSRAASATPPVVCTVTARGPGWLALVGDADSPRLVARIGRRRPSTDPGAVAVAVDWLARAQANEVTVSSDGARSEVERWLSHERARRLSGAARPRAARVGRRSLAATVAAVATATAHQRAAAAIAVRAGFDPSSRVEWANSDHVVRALVVFCAYAPAPGRSAL